MDFMHCDGPARQQSERSTCCLACGQAVTRAWLDNCRDLFLGTPYVVSYGECPACGLIQQVPLPVDTAPFYPQSYPMHASRGKFLPAVRSLLMRGVYYEPRDDQQYDVLFDFGSGDGSYLQSVRHRFGRTIGFEYSRHQAVRLADALKCPVYSDIAEASEELAGQVDVVTAHFVIEHLTDLHAAFTFWNRILKPGGTLYAVVPNIRSWEALIFRKKWHGLDPPRHISFPGGKNLSLLMDRHGFTLARKRYAVFPNNVAAGISNVLLRRYHHALFLAGIPIGFVIACIAPQGTIAYEMRKRE